CAVRIKSGQIRQPEALGISADLREQGYALLCVGYPSSDLEVETQDEDEVYWLQFGRYFARGPVVSIANFAYSRRAVSCYWHPSLLKYVHLSNFAKMKSTRLSISGQR
uniref:Ferredoxin n=1 Tax=Aegilops tauschii subsp. strangulata TaxID=200361 RepID=A0A453H3A8_AEGTS